MQDFNIIAKHEIKHTFRNDAIIGKFDIPPEKQIEFNIKGEIPDFDDDFKIGVIYGPSGSGKTTIAREVYHDVLKENSWNDTKSIIDNFDTKTTDSIVESLSSVGFNSIPAWLLPYSSLSNGQKFRADMARLICENKNICIDEFTSVVDRTVAKSVSCSLRKYANRKNKKIVLLSCHADILEWLEPDWIFYTENARLARDRLCRPSIEIAITKGSLEYWKYFEKNHYMTQNISKTAKVYLAHVFLNNMWHTVGFFSTVPAFGIKNWDRGHRTVVLSDYQGLGIGNAMIESVAEWLYETHGRRFRATTSSIPIIKHRQKRPKMWRCVAAPHMKARSGSGVRTSAGRLTTSWIYIPKDMR